jgi:hypothetical protein
MSKANKGSTGQQYDALPCNAGLTGSTAVLDDGARLGAYEAAENPKSEKKVTVSCKTSYPSNLTTLQ